MFRGLFLITRLLKLIYNFLSHISEHHSFIVVHSSSWAKFSQTVGFINELLPSAYEVNASENDHHHCNNTSSNQFILGHDDFLNVGICVLDVHVFEGDADPIILFCT